MQQTRLARPNPQRRAVVVSDPAYARDAGEALTIFCPSAEGLAGYPLDVLCALPIHDANGRLLDALGRRLVLPEHIYAGVFAVDPFRRRADILAAVRAAGIGRVANFPSVCRFDGAVRADFDALGFGLASEVEFIRDAVRDGFSAAALVDSPEAASAMIAAGAAVLIGIDPALAQSPALVAIALAAGVELLGLGGGE